MLCLFLPPYGCRWLQETAVPGTPGPEGRVRIEAYFDALAANRDFAGVVHVSRGEHVLYSGAWGVADAETGAAHSVSDRFAIASVTKTFTAAAILSLRDAGRLTLDDPVGRHLPEFPHGSAVTIRHLLRFESGLAEIDDTDRVYTSATLRVALGARPLLFTPGTDSRYGNAGFDLLALVVEAASGQSFGGYLAETFFQPLGMAATGERRALRDEDAVVVPPYAPGPPPAFLFRTERSSASLYPGSGGLYSTATDLARWGHAMARRRIVDVSRETYPWGWGRVEVEGHAGLEQTGMTRGFTSSLQVFAEDDLVIVVLNNVENGLWSTWASDLGSIVFGGTPRLAVTSYDAVDPPDPETRAALAGRYRLNDQRFVDVREHDGQLWIHLNGHPTGHYMLPLRDGSFQLRDFTGRITFERSGAGPATSALWRLPDVWGGQTETYHRTGNH